MVDSAASRGRQLRDPIATELRELSSAIADRERACEFIDGNDSSRHGWTIRL